MLARQAPAAPRRVRRRPADRRSIPAVRHITMPFAVTATAIPKPYERVGAFLQRTAWARREDRQWRFQLPTICVVNGQPLPRRQWKRRRIRPTDQVEFWSRPWGGQGGSGKQIVGIVALVALAAFAPYAAGAIGLTGLAATAFAAGVTIGGSLLVAALTRPNAGGQNPADATKDQVEQLYSVAAQGNTARLLQPLTVQYGRVKSFPDFAIEPWSEFIGNDQYLNVLLGVGLGKYADEAVYIDDTILWTPGGGVTGSFTGVTVERYDPNASVTLFPVNVEQSIDVSGQQIVTTPVGPFPANAAGSTANAVAIDLVWPQGCYGINNANGILVNDSVTVVVEAQPINNSGVPTGGWATIATQAFSFATRNPQRQTIKTAITPGRYQIRVSRTDAPHVGATITVGPNTFTAQNDVAWVGLRGFLDGPTSFPVTTVAIRIKANSQLTGTSARKFAYLGTRKVPVWNGSTMVDTATRNPVWAAYDAATNTEYGAGYPPSKIDFETVVNMATGADTRTDTFDYRFSSAVPVPEALDTILKVTRARHRWSGDMLTFVRDEWSSVPRMLLTDREIVRGSLALDYSLNTDDSADAVILEYVDEDIWGPAEIQYPHNSVGFTSVSPTRIRINGIVNRDHAHREAAFYYLQSQLRRIGATLDTEHDGRMLGFGSRIRLQTELPLSWGYTGAVTAAASNVLTASPAPTWDVGTHYIAIRTKTGRQFGPVLCTRGVDDAHIVLDPTDLAAVETAQSTTLATALARADGADEPSFDFGAGTARARDCIVLSGRPNRDRVTLTLVVDNIDVHATDLPDTPLRPDLPSLIDNRTPVISNLYATFRQGVIEPILDASWLPAAGAQYYVARVSYDGGVSWTQLAETIAPQLSAVVDRSNLRLQVAGVGVRHGAWTQVDVTVPAIRLAPDTVGIDALIAGLQDRVTNVLRDVQNRNSAIEQFIANYAVEQDAHNLIDKIRSKGRDSTIKSSVDGLFTDVSANYATSTTMANARAYTSQVAESSADAAIAAYDVTVRVTFATQSQVNAALANTLAIAEAHADSAVASLNSTVSASIGNLNARVTTNETVVATISGSLAASYGVQFDVNGYVGGFKLLSDGTSINAAWSVDHFTVGSAGLDSIPVFDIGTVGGIASVVIRGNIIADGTIQARHLDVGSVTASSIGANQIISSSANIGDLTVDTIHIKDGAISTHARDSLSSSAHSGSEGSADIFSVSKTVTVPNGRAYTARAIGRINVRTGSTATLQLTPALILAGISVDSATDGFGTNEARSYLMAGSVALTGTGSPVTITATFRVTTGVDYGTFGSWLDLDIFLA